MPTEIQEKWDEFNWCLSMSMSMYKMSVYLYVPLLQGWHWFLPEEGTCPSLGADPCDSTPNNARELELHSPQEWEWECLLQSKVGRALSLGSPQSYVTVPWPAPTQGVKEDTQTREENRLT